MRTIPPLLAVIALTALVGAAQEPQSLTAPIDSALQTSFEDDFLQDTRADYTIRGEVAWRPGRLTISEGASIEWPINGGERAKVELRLAEAWPPSTDKPAEVRLWFLLNGATNCYVRLKRGASDDAGQTATIALVDTGEKDGQPIEQVVRERPLSEMLNRLTIEYRRGLVTLGDGDAAVFMAHISNERANVVGCRLEATASSSNLTEIEVGANNQPTTLSESQQRVLAEASDANRKMNSLKEEKKFKEAALIGEHVLSMRKSVLGELHPLYANSLSSVASIYHSMGDLVRAESLLRQELVIMENLLGEWHPFYAARLIRLAVLCNDKGDYTGAIMLCTKASEIQRSVLGEQHRDYANSLSNLSFLYELTGDFALAEQQLLQELDVLKSVVGDQHSDYAEALHKLANVYASTNSFARAEHLYRQAMEIVKSEKGEENSDYADTLGDLAILYTKMADYNLAETLLQDSLEIEKAVLGEAHASYAVSLNNLALLYFEMADYAKAEPLVRKALSVMGEKHRFYDEGLNNLACVYHRMGDFARAEPLYWQAIEIRKSMLGEKHPRYGLLLNNLAYVYRDIGNYVRAEQLLRESSEIIKNALGEQHLDYAACIGNLALLYEEMGEFSQAEPLHNAANNIMRIVLGEQHPDHAVSLFDVARMCESKEDRVQAALLHIQGNACLSVAASNTISTLSEARARAWIRKYRPRADRVLSSLKRLEKFEAPDAYAAVWQTKLMISRLRVGQDPPQDSSPEALKIFAQLRDARLNLAKLVSATPEPEQAAQYRQAMAAASDKKEDLEKQLASLNPASRRELAIRDATVDNLLQHLPEGVAVIDFVRRDDWDFVEEPVTWKKEDGKFETRLVKKEKATPVYDAFVLRADRRSEPCPARWLRLGPAESIDRAVQSWRQQLTGEATMRPLGTDSDPTVAQPGPALRTLIWDKLEPELMGCRTVVLLPDGALHRLPWAALPGRNPEQFLIHDYALATASSGQQLFGLLSAPAIETQRRLLVAGGIEYDERPTPVVAASEEALFAVHSRTLDVSDDVRRWSFLNGAAAELTALTELWGDRGPVLRLEGLEAAEKTLADRLPDYRYAHLATHGFFDTKGEVYPVNLREQSLIESQISGSGRGSSMAARNPLLMTGIVMAGANVTPEKDSLGLPVGGDGILTAEEIHGLRLSNTELVTLSACETGLGDVALGEGVMGLTRVLHQAGVRTVMASLWKVDDAATLSLMTEFYRNLWEKQMDKIDALREAQLSMLRGYDPKSGKLQRGLDSKSGQVNLNKKTSSGASTSQRLDPRFWAAFQLSGDWR